MRARTPPTAYGLPMVSRAHVRAILAVALIAAAVPAGAHAQPAPSGKHPRLLLDDATRAAWRRRAKDDDSGVHRAIAQCDDVRARPREYTHDNYMALDWSAHLQACLVAWAATGDDAHARTAMRFFGAMLDDLDDVGDGKGGDLAANRDSGFAIRAMGPATALAYDWLHDHPLMTEALRARARRRFAAWTDWYVDHGYRARDPGNNYHAGYLIAATFIAIAERGEAGDAGDKLWRVVADEIWGKQMKEALDEGGILDGGDWTEGWQYGPLSVAEYAVSARVAAASGIAVPSVGRWLEQVLARAVYGLTPGGRTYAVGDAEDEQASLPPSPLPLAAVVIGDAPPAAQKQALGELRRLQLSDAQFPLFDALVDGRTIEPEPVPRTTWPTSYLAAGSGVLYARTSWRDDAIWGAFVCNHEVNTDHHHPNAGNLVVSRGKDDVIVDPSPYGTASSLTSNAPTVRSAHFPDDYQPSQGFWSTATGYTFAAQTSSGVLAMRCDYADQYRFQDTPSDVKRALRDTLLIPWNGGRDASIVVVDRATTGDSRRAMYLRFRTPGRLILDHGVARARAGRSALAIRTLVGAGAPEVRHLDKSDCFAEGTIKGRCDAARFAIDEYRTQIPGPEPIAIHVLDIGGTAVTARATGDAVHVVELAPSSRDPARVVVVADAPGDTMTYRVPRPGPAGSEHVVLDAPAAGDGTVGVTATAEPDGCAVTLTATGGTLRVAAAPASIYVDQACVLKDAAPRRAGAAPRIQSHAQGGGGPRRGSGCCGAQATPGSSLGTGAIVLALLLRRRRRPGDRTRAS
jgi:hypothetical protein